MHTGYAIVYCDDHLVVVEKAAGLLTVAATGRECLVDLLEAELDRQRFGRYRLAVIHRLDCETSGLLVFARTPVAAAKLAKQFAGQSVEREYVAVLAGRLDAGHGTIRSKLDAKAAVTHFQTLSRQADTTWVAVRLETGRRNQIRRHFAEMQHPVLGDRRFEPQLAARPIWPFTRLALHARMLGFEHPVNKKRLRFEAPLPGEFTRAAAGHPAPVEAAQGWMKAGIAGD
jgi:23S rRNA pseudouridine1911/1915/1917 synthase